MKLKPDRTKISRWILALLILGLSIWLIKLIRYQVALSSLYISKNPCSYSPEKSAVIFLDDRAQKTLLKLHMVAPDIAAEANRIFADHNLPFRYSIGNLKIRKWNSDDPDCRFLDARFADEASCFINEMRPLYKNEKKTGNPDILIFITASGINEMSGKSYWKVPQGNGTIVLNLGIDLKSYDSDEKLSGIAKKFFLRRFAHLLIHEQAHLYGADHSAEPYSIMKANLDMLGNHRVNFDGKSIGTLIKRNNELNKIRSQCAAQK